MTATVVQLHRRDKDEIHRQDDHFQMADAHPEEALLRERGLCALADDPTPWLDVRRAHHRTINKEAKELCLTKCPVQAACRRVVDHIEAPASMANRGSVGLSPQHYTGIWAGEFPNQRRLRRQREAREERKGA